MAIQKTMQLGGGRAHSRGGDVLGEDYTNHSLVQEDKELGPDFWRKLFLASMQARAKYGDYQPMNEERIEALAAKIMVPLRDHYTRSGTLARDHCFEVLNALAIATAAVVAGCASVGGGRGPGKYDELCTAARLAANAEGAILLVFDGDKGSGFSVQSTLEIQLSIPGILRQLADSIEADIKSS